MRLGLVGITGGIGEGKSTVLRYLREAGCRVASADEIARELLRNPDIKEEVASISGLRVDFEPLDLRNRVIADDGIRKALNYALHPRIVKELQKKAADFVEVPLLVETALQTCFDAIWVVTCGPDEQRARLLQRTGDQALSEQLLALQLPTSAKLPFADVIVRTNASRRRVKAYTLEAAIRVFSTRVANHAK
jgi:dephospho-CoA kinase